MTITRFSPLAGSRIGELTAHWDIILATTPELP